MSKYDPLKNHLARSQGRLEFSFEDIEEILGFPLPPSARKYEAWWSNSGGSHVQSAAWMDAGYSTAAVKVAEGMLNFVPDQSTQGFGEMEQATFKSAAKHGASGGKPTSVADKTTRHPLFGIWKGLVTLVPGYDYTKPAFDEWKELYGDKD